ncbi:MAG: divergent PAP2 family protein [Clostridia bacterium]|nr:divergent PAP2 family protein [Clostridia bacterium]
MVNHYIICSITAWFTAQLIKFLITLIKHKKVDFERFVGSGGMPSAHAAFTCSLTTLVLFIEGFSSAEFAIAFCFMCVVLYDATGVRRETGKQAKVLNTMMEEWVNQGSTANFGEHLKELVGHSKTEVTVGFIYGVAIGITYYLLIVK